MPTVKKLPTVKELRTELVTKHPEFTDAEARKLTKAAIINILYPTTEESEVQHIGDALAEAINFGDEDSTGDFEIEINTTPEALEDNSISITDSEWTAYVLKELHTDEWSDGYPTVDGLRRLAYKYIGELINTETHVLQVPDISNERRATVKYSMTFDDQNGVVKTFEAAADVFWGNCDKVFARHPVATAESRAEGRVLRKALNLRKIISAEEVANNIEEEIQMITANQINFLDMMCGPTRLNISIHKFVNMGSQQYKTITEVTHDKALKMIQALNDYQQNPSSIPVQIQTYDGNWKQHFYT